MNRKILRTIVRLLIILFVVLVLGNRIRENYSNNKVTNVDPVVSLLYPTQGLQHECKKLGHYPPSYMPMKCFRRNGKIEQKQNCKCMDKTGTYCTVCYPPIVHSEPSQQELQHKYPYMAYK